MSSIHGPFHDTALYGPPWTVVVPAALLIGYHLLRAVLVRRSSADGWMRRRGLPLEPRLIADVERHLRVQHLSRGLVTTALAGISLLLAELTRAGVSFLTLPVMLSVVLAQLLAPEPRLGRVRLASLQARARDYFAPRRPLTVARIVLALAVVLSLAAALGDGRFRTESAGHGVVLMLGAAVLELGLVRITRRGLPQASADLAVDVAVRVASARTLVAGALVFSGFGLLLSAVTVASGHQEAVLGLGLAEPAAIALAVWGLVIAQPLRSWQASA